MESRLIKHGLDDIRLLGRMDTSYFPVALDWTGSGMEVHFQGTSIWAELEAPSRNTIMWMIVLSDGSPVSRFPVEPGCRYYPLLLGMEAEKSRTVTLIKETQPMPSDPKATVFLRSIRFDGKLLPLSSYKYRIEFIGDSLTSGEGALAPRGNEEWITPWFSARGNYSWYTCQSLNAERRILSQSGYGVCWDWEHCSFNNMKDGYEKIAGVLFGSAAEKRGCQKKYDFSSWKADAVCIRLLTNDSNGMKEKNSFDEEKEFVINSCIELINKVRINNADAKIIWILPGSDSHPEIAEEAVERAKKTGMTGISCFALPDYSSQDMGARFHPNAEWNKRAGMLLTEYLKTIL